MSRPSNLTLRALVATTLVAAAAVAPGSYAQQQSTTARPADKPPTAQGWIDIATYSSPGMPSGMAGMMIGGGGLPMSSMYGGGHKDGNVFGNARHGGGGSYVDVSLRTSRNPALGEAIQTVPAGTKLAPFGLKDALDAVKDSVPLPN